MASAWRRIVPTSTGFGIYLGTVALFVVGVMHVNACTMGAFARSAKEEANEY